jgi:hypothetical protein
MKRDLYKRLLQWKKDPARQPLLVQGARQVGKTYLLKEFGAQEYKNCCYINFEEMPACKLFFESDLKPQRWQSMQLSTLPHQPISDGKASGNRLMLDLVQNECGYFPVNVSGFHRNHLN